MPPYSDELGQAMGLWKPHSATQHTDIPTAVGSQQCSDAHKCLLPCPSHQVIYYLVFNTVNQMSVSVYLLVLPQEMSTILPHGLQTS